MYLIFLTVLSLSSGVPVSAAENDIAVLEAEHGVFALYQDSLTVERQHLVWRADSLSVVIDSLKGSDSSSGDLEEALLASLVLVQRLVQVDQRMDSLAVRWEVQREDLRRAYDFDIGRLIQELSHSQRPDRNKLRRLRIYQEARDGLGTRIVPSRMQYAGQMDIGPDDGPDEISQKLELMEDIAARLKYETLDAEFCIKQLEVEQRLRQEMTFFTQEISLFDEHLPEGRILDHGRSSEAVLSQEIGPGATEIAEVGFADAVEVSQESGVAQVDFADAAEMPQDDVLLNREAVRGEHLVPENINEKGIVLEIHKLTTRCRELRELEMVIQERIDVFHAGLQQIAEGQE